MERQVQIKKEVLETVVKSENVSVREFWVARGISNMHKKKTVVIEREFENPPTLEDIAKLCHEYQYNVDFFSVEHHYACLTEELPFA